MISEQKLVEFEEKGVLQTLNYLGEQFKQGFSFEFFQTDNFKPEKIVWMGMGGSALAADIVSSYYQKELKVPVIVWNTPDYPDFIKENDLVVVSSYSGNTQESIDFYYQAIKAQAHIFGLTSNGKLEELFKENQTTFHKIDTNLNPSNQPRMGAGFGMGFLLRILLSFKLINQEEVEKDIDQLEMEAFETKGWVDFESEEVVKASEVLKDKIAVILSSPTLTGLAHFFQNQLNETAKQMASYYFFPELNHHLLEGLSGKQQKSNLGILLIREDDERVNEGINLTKNLLDKLGIKHHEIQLQDETRLKRLLRGISLAQHLSLTLADYYQVDPLGIPQVDWFKENLS